MKIFCDVIHCTSLKHSKTLHNYCISLVFYTFLNYTECPCEFEEQRDKKWKITS